MVLDDFFTFVFFVELVCNLFANWFWPFFTDGTIRVESKLHLFDEELAKDSFCWRPTETVLDRYCSPEADVVLSRSKSSSTLHDLIDHMI